MVFSRMATGVLVWVVVALEGCATTRSEVQIPSAPPQATIAANPDAPRAVLRVVKDSRRFEQAPGDPSTPSLGFEGAEKATADTRLRAVGRKRNGFGQAIGDVLLQQGQTVEGLVRAALVQALGDAGYNVVAASDTGPSLEIDAQINRLWAWIEPGFWAITLRSEVAVDLALSNRNGPATVAVSVADPHQFITDSDWIETIGKALSAFRIEAARKIPPAVRP